MNKKKLVSLCLVLALAITAAIGGTMAYFTDKEEATNTFTVGNVDITLTEADWVQPETVVPGQTYDKTPVVNNVGANDAWVRVDVTISDAAEFQAAAQAHGITDLATIFKNHDESKWVRAAIVPGNDNTLTYQYYYNAVVPAEGTTGAIFTDVEIPAAFNNADMESLGDDFTIEVVAHAIQISEDYGSAADAFAAYEAQQNQ